MSADRRHTWSNGTRIVGPNAGAKLFHGHPVVPLRLPILPTGVLELMARCVRVGVQHMQVHIDRREWRIGLQLDAAKLGCGREQRIREGTLFLRHLVRHRMVLPCTLV